MCPLFKGLYAILIIDVDSRKLRIGLRNAVAPTANSRRDSRRDSQCDTERWLQRRKPGTDPSHPCHKYGDRLKLQHWGGAGGLILVWCHCLLLLYFNVQPTAEPTTCRLRTARMIQDGVTDVALSSSGRQRLRTRLARARCHFSKGSQLGPPSPLSA
ncbi:hypothetical protein BT67DRAFT_264880 [Trichocladium antarcticum]|uniref:Uncharacterized protein n=1 Tax=Trichocladium antarcticum TaxID=1450529 RepID=A0AAN6UNH3_9PEZI|nr:hypothetical protein BT67DRAFT_264880 [Trichocladium antarcticum]